MAIFLSFIIMAAIFLRIIAWLLKPLIKPVVGTAGIVALIVYLVRRHKHG
ncbi:hypothetical protein [Companilactobacillus sp.]|nr:hypothetical protein [Companilactobacillus sp.]